MCVCVCVLCVCVRPRLVPTLPPPHVRNTPTQPHPAGKGKRGSIADIISPFVEHATRLQIWCEDHTVNWCEVVTTGHTPGLSVTFTPYVTWCENHFKGGVIACHSYINV